MQALRLARSAWSEKGPGVMVCLTIALAATFLAQQYGGPQLLHALLIGLVLHFLHDHPQTRVGIEFCGRTLLRLGVALLGARITVDAVARLGFSTALIVAGGLALTILAGLLLARLLRRPPEEGLLTGGAVAICGASAAMAISALLPQSRENERLTLLTVVGVTALSTLAMIIYPFALRHLPLSPTQAGIFLGGTIHDVAQVVAAGTMLGPQAADAATLVKLFRVLLLIPVVLLITLALQRRTGRAEASPGKTRRSLPTVPSFLLAFIAFVLLSSSGFLPAPAIAVAGEASRWLLVIAIAAAGVKTSFEDLLQLGWRPVLMLVAETLFIAAFVLGALLVI